MLSKTPYMKMYIVSKIQQKCQTLQPNKGFSLRQKLTKKKTIFRLFRSLVFRESVITTKTDLDSWRIKYSSTTRLLGKPKAEKTSTKEIIYFFYWNIVFFISTFTKPKQNLQKLNAQVLFKINEAMFSRWRRQHIFFKAFLKLRRLCGTNLSNFEAIFGFLFTRFIAIGCVGKICPTMHRLRSFLQREKIGKIWEHDKCSWSSVFSLQFFSEGWLNSLYLTPDIKKIKIEQTNGKIINHLQVESFAKITRRKFRITIRKIHLFA